MKKHICPHCKKEFFSKKSRIKFCSNGCKIAYWSIKSFDENASVDNYVECKICGYRGKQINKKHLMSYHNCTIDEYCARFNCTSKDLICKETHAKKSDTSLRLQQAGKCGWQKGKANPSQTDEVRNGRKSIFSMNYAGYDGLSDEEKTSRIKEASRKVVQKMNDGHNNPLRIDYYTSRGYSKKEAKCILADRQCTFSLKKCIQRYGEVEGRRIFNERQLKWQNTLNSKPIEEIERINKAKMMNNIGYSKISQELFNKIYLIIQNSYTNIYYATINNSQFAEYMVHDYKLKCNYFLDFYVKDNNKVIEFDGDYWHGEKRGNQRRDKERENALRKLGFVNIMRVKERDYKANPDKVVAECIEFIRQ